MGQATSRKERKYMSMGNYVKCAGYTKYNMYTVKTGLTRDMEGCDLKAIRQAAKIPLDKNWLQRIVDAECAEDWLKAGGWIGMIIPEGFVVVDVDDMTDAETIESILQSSDLKYSQVNTLKGKQFFFKGNLNKQSCAKWCGLGLQVDYRLGGKGQIILPESEPEIRSWAIKLDLENMDELPKWLEPINVSKDNEPDFSEGNRNTGLHSHAVRLFGQGWVDEEVEETIDLINSFILDEPLDSNEINTILKSAATFAQSKEFSSSNPEEKKLINSAFVKRQLDKWGITLKYDELHRQISISEGGKTQQFTDIHAIKIYDGFLTKGIAISKNKLWDLLIVIAHQNSFNPAIDYILQSFEQMTCFDIDYIKELYCCLNLRDEHKLCYTMFRKWLIQSVSIAFNQGQFKAENVLVLQGGQSIGKTTFLKGLAPTNLVKEGVTLDPGNKDSVLRALDPWICELGELDSTLKSEQAALKAFLSESHDCIRLPYERTAVKTPRHTTFCASVNKSEFLKDETGARRFWILELESIDMDKFTTLDMSKVWGYAYYLWKNKLEIGYLDRQETAILMDINTKYDEQTEAMIWLDSIIDEEAEEKEIQMKDLLVKAKNDFPSITMRQLSAAITQRRLPYKMIRRAKYILIKLKSEELPF